MERIARERQVHAIPGNGVSRTHPRMAPSTSAGQVVRRKV